MRKDFETIRFKSRLEVELEDAAIKIDHLETILKQYKRALEGLTPGGSEFANDPERCAAFVRDKMEHRHRLIVKFKLRGDKILTDYENTVKKTSKVIEGLSKIIEE
jgi:hypothetical protein